MKQKSYFFIGNMVFIVLIVIGFIGMQINDFSFYRQTATEQAQNDVRLSAMDINTKITLIAEEQCVVSQMMANDIFLKQWCANETGNTEDESTKVLYDYLNEYKKKYKYDVVFFVSDKTYNYYYDGGLNKVISPDVEFDSWYFNFLDLNQEYDIQIDHDEVNDYGVSLFVNCIVKDNEGNILGVVGAGKVVNDFQESIDELVNSLEVDICIVNMGNAHNSFSGSAGVYKTVEDAANDMNLTEDEVTQEVGESGKMIIKADKCVDIVNNGMLNWNIIVQKDLNKLISEMMVRSYGKVVLMLIVMFIYIVVSFKLLSNHRKIELIKENTDELTGLINKKLFEQRFEKNRIKKFWNQNICLFILDVDNFKSFNDNYGHLYGNTILKIMASTLKEEIGIEGEVARWGGDEFVGVVYCKSYLAQRIFEEILQIVRIKDSKTPITFSCGVVDCNPMMTLNEMLERADTALYEAKENGKAQVCVYKE